VYTYDSEKAFSPKEESVKFDVEDYVCLPWILVNY